MKNEDILIIPPQGKRKGRIILEACYKEDQTVEEKENLNSIIFKQLVNNGLFQELELVKNINNQ